MVTSSLGQALRWGVRVGSETEAEILSLLGLFGLNSYQSRLYVALYKGGSTTVRELSRVSGVPYARCYDVAAGLERLGLVASVPTRPRRFEAVDPVTGLKRLMAGRMGQIEEEIERAVSGSREEGARRREALEDAFAKIAARLPGMVSPLTRRSEPMWAIEGWANVQAAAVDMLAASRKEFLFTVNPPPWSKMLSYPYLWGETGKELYERVAEGVAVRGLVPRGAVGTYLGMRDLGVPELRVAESVPAKFAVSDGSSVLIGVSDPDTGLDRSSAIYLQSRAVSSVFESFFRTMWVDAIPVQEILPHLGKRVDSLIESMQAEGSEIQARVFRALVDRGLSTVDEIREELRIYDKRQTPARNEVSEALGSLISRKRVAHDRILDSYMPLIE